MNKYIKPETKIVEVKMESLLNDASFGSEGGTVSGTGTATSSYTPFEDCAGKNHRTNPLWDQSWEDPEGEEENQ